MLAFLVGLAAVILFVSIGIISIAGIGKLLKKVETGKYDGVVPECVGGRTGLVHKLLLVAAAVGLIFVMGYLFLGFYAIGVLLLGG